MKTSGMFVLAGILFLLSVSSGSLCAAIPYDFNNDAKVDVLDFTLFAQDWLYDYGSVKIQWLGHASFRISNQTEVVYIDPWKIEASPHDATVVLVSHTHSDHYSPADIANVSGPSTVLIAPPDVIAGQGAGQKISPWQTIIAGSVRVTAIPAYNINKTYHPRINNWVGFILEIGSRRIYYAGDTDLTPEMKALSDIDVALLPAGGTYTTTAAEAGDAANYIKPTLAIPCHWGDIVGSSLDAGIFADSTDANVKILAKNEIISSENWKKDFFLQGYWKLNETTGTTAYDSSGNGRNGTLTNMEETDWVSGRICNSLDFDGIDDYVRITDYKGVTGPTSRTLTAWIKTSTTGDILGWGSVVDGGKWILWVQNSASGTMGALRAEVYSGYIVGKTDLRDNNWHHVAAVLKNDGSPNISEVLFYVDGKLESTTAVVPYAVNTTNSTDVSIGGFLITPRYFRGQIDDVRIYNRALSEEKINSLLNPEL